MANRSPHGTCPPETEIQMHLNHACVFLVLCIIYEGKYKKEYVNARMKLNQFLHSFFNIYILILVPSAKMVVIG